MKRQRISETINYINESIIDEATNFQKAKATKRTVWMKWTAIAACFALVLAIGIPMINNVFLKPNQDDVLELRVIEYDNAYYEILEGNQKRLNEKLSKLGLPTTKVTAELAGEHLAYLDNDNNKELFEYKPANNKAHLIYREGDKYYIVRFCNYLNPDDVSYPVSKALEIFGIYGAENIKSIASADNDKWLINGDSITDKEIIKSFYNEIIVLLHYSEEEYHELAFEGYPSIKEAENKNSADAEIYTKYADDLRGLIIETTDGIRFRIDYYPSYKWIYFSETQTYCQMTSAMEQWFKNNIK